MTDSLRDQLLKLGLANKQQAKQATAHKPKPSRHQPAKPDPAATAAQRAQAAKLLRDQELNRKEQAKLEARARAAQLRQLIDQHRLPPLQTDDYFSFMNGQRIARVPVDAERRAGLSAGTLLIASFAGRYDIIPASAAERLRERDPAVVIDPNAPVGNNTGNNTGNANTAADAEDPYKDFVVPDDLTW
jgi:uncharacterized protein YaiL (DUF2058 family)